MAVTWTKTTVTRTNPFDELTETVIEVNDVRIDDVPCREHYTFADGTTDAAIQQKIETDLAAKGYAL